MDVPCAPMGKDCIRYLVYPGSIELSIGPFTRSLQMYIEDQRG